MWCTQRKPAVLCVWCSYGISFYYCCCLVLQKLCTLCDKIVAETRMRKASSQASSPCTQTVYVCVWVCMKALCSAVLRTLFCSKYSALFFTVFFFSLRSVSGRVFFATCRFFLDLLYVTQCVIWARKQAHAIKILPFISTAATLVER